MFPSQRISKFAGPLAVIIFAVLAATASASAPSRTAPTEQQATRDHGRPEGGSMIFNRPPAAKARPVVAQIVQTTSTLSNALALKPSRTFGKAPHPGAAVIKVNPLVRYQTIVGFGGAMTDTSAWLLYDELTPQQRQVAMAALFGAQGIHLNFVRIPMGASDFVANGVPYSYDDQPTGQTDPSLSDFSIVHDEPYIIPALKEMLSINPRIITLANPWSPPPWMKANDAYNDAHLAGTILGSTTRRSHSTS